MISFLIFFYQLCILILINNWSSMQFCAGVVKSKRSIWRLKTITDFFWAIVNFIGVFFATMFSVILTRFLIHSTAILRNFGYCIEC